MSHAVEQSIGLQRACAGTDGAIGTEGSMAGMQTAMGGLHTAGAAPGAPHLARRGAMIAQARRLIGQNRILIADDSTTIPRSLRNRLMSINVLAITGKAEIDIAVPKNNANT